MSGTQPADKLTRLEEEVRAARGDLAATVDELTGWFDPKTRLAAAKDRGRQMLHDAADPAADPSVRTRARIVLGVTAAATTAVVAGVVRRLVRR